MNPNAEQLLLTAIEFATDGSGYREFADEIRRLRARVEELSKEYERGYTEAIEKVFRVSSYECQAMFCDCNEETDFSVSPEQRRAQVVNTLVCAMQWEREHPRAQRPAEEVKP